MALPVALRKVSLRLTPFRRVRAAGCIRFTAPGYQSDQSGQPILVEYSARKNGPWRLLGSMPSAGGGQEYCPRVGASWTGSFKAKLANAYYRERVPGDAGTEPTVSTVVHLFKEPTKIVAFAISPRRVHRRGKLTISGQLLQDVGSWRPDGHRQIVILFRPRGQTIWSQLATTSTAVTGSFRVTVADPGNGTWVAAYDGDAGRFASRSKGLDVSVVR